MFRLATSALTLLAFLAHAVLGSCHQHGSACLELAHNHEECAVVGCGGAAPNQHLSIETDADVLIEHGSHENCPHCACALRNTFVASIAHRIGDLVTIDLGLRNVVVDANVIVKLSIRTPGLIRPLDGFSCAELQSWKI